MALFLAVVGAVFAAWCRARAAQQEALAARRAQREAESAAARLREQGLVDQAARAAEAADVLEARASRAESDREAAEAESERIGRDLDRAQTREDWLEAIARRGLMWLIVASLAASGPSVARAEPPGRLTSWTAPPSAEVFEAAAGEDGFVVVLDEPRLRHWLAEVDRGRVARARLAAVEEERDRWRELAAARGEELAAVRAVLAEVRSDRARLRLEVAGLDKALARRPRARRAWLVAGVALGAAGAWELLR